MTTNTTPQKTPILRIERVFNATPERLWAYWTDPEKYAKWLNPAPIDLVIHEFDVRLGGKVRFDMPQPDGNKNPQEGVFHKLDPYKEIVTGEADKSFLVRVLFVPMSAKMTRMVVNVTGLTTEWHSPATVGWNQGLDKLAALLGTPVQPHLPPGAKAVGTIQGRSVRVERFVNAPPSKVWSFWTNAAKLEKWFWPAGVGKVQEFSFRPGGRLVMAHAEQPWKATWEFVEIVPETKIVIRDHWDDGSGHFATGTIEFQPSGAGTRVVVTHGPFPEKGPYRLEDAVSGFGTVMDHLAELVEEEPDTGFTIERTFQAKPEKLWHMWTTKEGLEKWWVLSARDMGYAMRIVRLDVRVGGQYEFELKDEKVTLRNHGTYTTVKPHSKLAWTWRFDIFLAPSETPYDVPISVDLEPVAGGTKMTFRQGPLASPEHTEGSRQGVMANLEKLAKALEA